MSGIHTVGDLLQALADFDINQPIRIEIEDAGDYLALKDISLEFLDDNDEAETPVIIYAE